MSASASATPPSALEVGGGVGARGGADVAALGVGEHEQAGRARVGADVLEGARSPSEPSASKKASCGLTATTYGATASTTPRQNRPTAAAASRGPDARRRAAPPGSGRAADRGRRRAACASARPRPRAGLRTAGSRPPSPLRRPAPSALSLSTPQAATGSARLAVRMAPASSGAVRSSGGGRRRNEPTSSNSSASSARAKGRRGRLPRGRPRTSISAPAPGGSVRTAAIRPPLTNSARVKPSSTAGTSEADLDRAQPLERAELARRRTRAPRSGRAAAPRPRSAGSSTRSASLRLQRAAAARRGRARSNSSSLAPRSARAASPRPRRLRIGPRLGRLRARPRRRRPRRRR